MYLLPPFELKARINPRSIWFRSPATSRQFMLEGSWSLSVIVHIVYNDKDNYLSKTLWLSLFFVQFKQSFNPTDIAATPWALMRLHRQSLNTFSFWIWRYQWDPNENKNLLYKPGHHIVFCWPVLWKQNSSDRSSLVAHIVMDLITERVWLR